MTDSAVRICLHCASDLVWQTRENNASLFRVIRSNCHQPFFVRFRESPAIIGASGSFDQDG